MFDFLFRKLLTIMSQFQMEIQTYYKKMSSNGDLGQITIPFFLLGVGGNFCFSKLEFLFMYQTSSRIRLRNIILTFTSREAAP